jgi:hypothetical protein
VKLVVEQLEDRLVPSTLIPVSNHRDLVYDPVHNQLDIISGGSILQFNTQVQQLVGSIGVVPNTLNGADITADGKYLYVADPATFGSRGLIHQVDLNSYWITNLPYTRASGETGTWDVALGANGRGLLDTTNTAPSMVPLRQINLSTGALTTRTDDPGAGGAGRIPSNTLIHRSADRSLFLFTESNLSSGPIFTYNAITDTFAAGPSLGANLTNALSAVNRNGTLMAIEVPGGLLVMDQHFSFRNFLQGVHGGVIFDPTQDVMYAVNLVSDQVVAYDTNTWQIKYQMAIGEPTTPGQAFGNGVMAVSNDGKWLFLATPGGVREFGLPNPNPATHLLLSGNFNGIETAGASFSLTVTAMDAYNQVATGYQGTLHFSSSDAQAGLPADYTFNLGDAGVHTFNFTLKTAGSQWLLGQDVSNPNLGFYAAGITVKPGALAGFRVDENSLAPAGYVIYPVISARDAYKNLITTYTGTVHLGSSDPAAVLPPDYTFTANDGGLHPFPVTLGTAGNQTLTVTDTANSTAQGSTTVLVANYIPGLHFTVSSTATFVPAGTPFSFTATAWDMYGQVATRYVGTVAFSSSDHASGVVLPANYTFTAADAGVHTFSATLVTAANPASVTFNDTSYVLSAGPGGGTPGGGPGGGIVVAITPAPASTLVVGGFPATTTAGISGSFTVTAKDPYGNVATGYNGTVHFASSDAQTGLPADYTFTSSDQGVHTFNLALKAAGLQSLTATDIASPSLTGSQSGISVTPAAASSFAVTGFPSPATMGTAGTFTVTALDPFGNVATGYTGTVHFTSSDPLAGLPADYAFTTADAGINSFSAVLNTPGLKSITATDSGAPALAGSQTGINVDPGASSFSVTGFPSPTTAGTAATFTVTALDTNGNVAPGYLGTLHFTSSDAQAVLPADYTFTAADQGVHTFTAMLCTAGLQSLSASDLLAPAVTGSQAGITVAAAAASSFLVNGFPSTVIAGTQGSVTVMAVDNFGNAATGYTGTVHVTSGDPLAQLSADYTFTAADQGVHVFQATLCRSHFESITVTDVAAATITGSQTGIVVNPAQATQIPMGYPVYPQAGVAFTLIVNIMDNYGNVVTNWTGTVHFQSSDPQAVLPADYTFTAADQGSHVFEVTLGTLGAQTVQVSDAAGILYSYPMYMTVVS